MKSTGSIPHLVLGSTSVYRRELLTRLNIPFTVRGSGVDEAPLLNESPLSLAERLSLAKAKAVLAAYQGELSPSGTSGSDVVVIGCDQTATINGRDIIGKPGDHAGATRQLQAASGKELTFYSGLAVLRPSTGFSQMTTVATTVRFRVLTDKQIEAYLQTEKPYDCTGSAKIESLGIALVDRVDCPDPTALIGLPLIALTTLLLAAGIDVLTIQKQSR